MGWVLFVGLSPERCHAREDAFTNRSHEAIAADAVLGWIWDCVTTVDRDGRMSGLLMRTMAMEGVRCVRRWKAKDVCGIRTAPFGRLCLAGGREFKTGLAMRD